MKRRPKPADPPTAVVANDNHRECPACAVELGTGTCDACLDFRARIDFADDLGALLAQIYLAE